MDFTVRNSCQWVALQMAAYVGVTNFTAAPTSLDPDDTQTYLSEGLLDTIAGIQTAALQDIADDGPASISEAPGGGALFAPAAATVNVTQGGTEAAFAAGWQGWMNGCAILIAGDGFANEITTALTGFTPAPVTTAFLRRPYLGPTANGVSATVFCTAVQLPANTKAIIEPVETAASMPCGPLDPCADRAEYDRISGCAYHSSAIYTGWPRAFLVERHYDPMQPDAPMFLRVAPAPQCPLPLTWRAKLLPPTITTANLGTATADPQVMPPIPAAWVESIFLPYCLQRFSGTPLFKNASALPEIARQYADAKKKLSGMKTQIVRSGRSYAFPP